VPNGFHGLTVADLDEIDQRIVEQLQADGRAAVTAIAEAIGLSHAATRQRVQRLFESRIVQIAAITSPATHGYQRTAIIGVRTSGDLREVAHAIAAIPEAYYVVISTGSYDVLAEIMCRDDQHMIDLVGQIRAIDGVVSTESFAFLDLVKWEYHPAMVPRAMPSVEP
jgi:Lrp/AsnC family transcriptional regulator for asnA, asnC and gidA